MNEKIVQCPSTSAKLELLQDNLGTISSLKNQYQTEYGEKPSTSLLMYDNFSRMYSEMVQNQPAQNEEKMEGNIFFLNYL